MKSAASQRLLSWMKDESRSERLLPSLSTGLLIGVNEVIFSISIGSLLFSGELAAYLSWPRHDALALTLALVYSIIGAYLSIVATWYPSRS